MMDGEVATEAGPLLQLDLTMSLSYHRGGRVDTADEALVVILERGPYKRFAVHSEMYVIIRDHD